MIPSWARKGAKVVCVNDAAFPEQIGPEWMSDTGLREGAIYTIRGLSPCWSGQTGVLLAEVVYPVDGRLGAEPGYRISRFRPLIEPKTEAQDRAFFRHWLKVPHSTATTRAPAEVSDA